MSKILYKKKLLAVLLFSFLFSSCSEDIMDGVNDYDGYPKDVQLQFILPGLITNTAFSTVGADFSTYASVYVEHEGGIYNQLYNAEMRLGEPTSISTYNNPWEQTYTNIMVAKTMIKKAQIGVEAGSKVQEGLARFFLAYNAAVLTDLFGDVAYSQAGVTDDKGIPVYRTPKLDKQEDIYKDIFAQLDTATVLIQSKITGPIGLAGSSDYIYGGDTDRWIKAINGLKARYTMRLLDKSTNKTEDLENVIKFIDNSFTSSSDALSYAVYNGTSAINPLAAFTYSRASLGASGSFVEKLKERKDPRYNQMFVSSYNPKDSLKYITINNPSKIVAVPNGTSKVEQSQTTYSCNITDIAADAPTFLLSYHELLFIKAEAYARLGDVTNAQTFLKMAINESFNNLSNSIIGAVKNNRYTLYPTGFDLSATVSANYYTNSVKALFDANPLKEIMIQKYLGMNGANGESIETYNDIRRMQGLGEDFVTLANPLNAQQKFPYRYTYGSSSVTTNPALDALVGDGSYVYRNKVWWAGGNN